MAQYQIEKDFLKRPDGQELYFEKISQPNAKTAMIILHGLGEHVGRYRDVATHYAKKGYNVYSYDQRGHGKTPGIRVYVQDFQLLVDDLKDFVGFVRHQEKKQKLFLVACSFGGLVALKFLAQGRGKFDGAIFLAPLIKAGVNIPLIKKVMLNYLPNFLGRVRVHNEIDTGNFSHDPEVAKDYEEDPLVNQTITLAWAREMFKNTEKINSLASKINIPCLFLHGKGDRVTLPLATKKFYNKVKSQDKKLILYPKFYHELLNEIGKEKVYRDMDHWIDERNKNSCKNSATG